MKTINYNNRQPDTDITEKSAIDRFFSSKIFMYICIGLVVIPLVTIFHPFEYNAENNYRFKPYIKTKGKIISCELIETKDHKISSSNKSNKYKITIEFLYDGETISVDMKSNHKYNENSTYTIYYLTDSGNISFHKPEEPIKLSKFTYVICVLSIILGLYLMTHVLKPKKITRRYVINTSDNPFQNTGNTAKKISEDILFYHKKK